MQAAALQETSNARVTIAGKRVKDRQGDAGAPPLQVDETIAGWTCGRYEVEGKHRYLHNCEAHFSYLHTREHVVMAVVKQTRVLLLAKSLDAEAGYWYVFFKPDQVQEVAEGYLKCGLKQRPGLAIRYRSADGSDQVETVYLAFSDGGTVQRVLADLRMDFARGIIRD